MKDQLVSFETAKLAKEKRFNIPTNYTYANSEVNLFSARANDETDYNWNGRAGFSAPTQSLLQKWLREEYKLHIEIFIGTNNKFGYYIHDLNIENIFDRAKTRIYVKAQWIHMRKHLRQDYNKH